MGQYENLSADERRKVNDAVKYDLQGYELMADSEESPKPARRDYENGARESWSSPQGLEKIDNYLKTMKATPRIR